MANFIRPHFLGSMKRFNRLYKTPIESGNHAEATDEERKYGLRRQFALFKRCSFTHRKNESVLKDFLPDKHECVLVLKQSPLQAELCARWNEFKGDSLEIGSIRYNESVLAHKPRSQFLSNWPTQLRLSKEASDGDKASRYSPILAASSSHK